MLLRRYQNSHDHTRNGPKVFENDFLVLWYRVILFAYLFLTCILKFLVRVVEMRYLAFPLQSWDGGEEREIVEKQSKWQALHKFLWLLSLIVSTRLSIWQSTFSVFVCTYWCPTEWRKSRKEILCKESVKERFSPVINK